MKQIEEHRDDREEFKDYSEKIDEAVTYREEIEKHMLVEELEPLLPEWLDKYGRETPFDVNYTFSHDEF